MAIAHKQYYRTTTTSRSTMEIKVVESTVVKPSEATPTETIWMSNMDTIFTDSCHANLVFFYRPNGADDFFDAAALKSALSLTLVLFYPLAGRLKRDNNGRFEIDCNGMGALFVVAECGGEMDEVGEYFMPRPDLTLIPPVDYSKGISNTPLFLAQVTRFRCGGVCLGVALEHHLADGISTLQFLNTWADIAHDLNVMIIPPSFDRRVLSAHNPPQPKYPHIEYQPSPRLKTPRIAPQTMYSVFKLTRDQLNSLKGKYNRDNGRATYTTHEVFAGHVWRCATISRQLPEDQETMLSVVIDGRSRLEPNLPQGFFGNVVFNATTIASAGELQSNPITYTVRKVHKAIAQMNNDYLRSTIDYLELQSDINSTCQDLFNCPCPNLGIVSWSRLPFYDVDFGWGRPIHGGLARVPDDGWSYVLPSPTNDGSLLVAIVLTDEEMERFEKLFYNF